MVFNAKTYVLKDGSTVFFIVDDVLTYNTEYVIFEYKVVHVY